MSNEQLQNLPGPWPRLPYCQTTVHLPATLNRSPHTVLRAGTYTGARRDWQSLGTEAVMKSCQDNWQWMDCVSSPAVCHLAAHKNHQGSLKTYSDPRATETTSLGRVPGISWKPSQVIFNIQLELELLFHANFLTFPVPTFISLLFPASRVSRGWPKMFVRGFL